VRTLAGTALTEAAPADHLHHFGIGVAPADVDGVTFWGGRTYVRGEGSTLLDNHGRQALLSASAEVGRWAGSIAWLAGDGAELGREHREIAATELDRGWLLSWRSRLVPASGLTVGSPATNGRDGAFYGGWFWRTPFRDADVLVRGGAGEGAAHGSLSPWIAVRTRDATLVTVQRGEPRPWFVRTGQYTGFGPALAWAERLTVTPDNPLSIALDTAVLDGWLPDSDVAALAAHTLARA